MTFEESVEIAASPSVLFALSQDYDRRLEWDPFPRSASLLNASAPGIGVRALCVARNGLEMETEYVTFDPPRVTAVKMTRGPWIIRSFAGTWRFEATTAGRTRVGFRYHLHSRPIWLAWLLDPCLSAVFGRDTRKRLAALKSAVESGRMPKNGSNPS